MSNTDLLMRIVAHPSDDGARLAYAAWLDSNGDPDRAELIRLQIARAASGGEWTPREIALVRDNSTRWEDELPERPVHGSRSRGSWASSGSPSTRPARG